MHPSPSSIETHPSTTPLPAESLHAKRELRKVAALKALCLASAAFLLALIGWRLLDDPKKTLTEAELLQIKRGMTKDEVRNLLGPPEPRQEYDLAYGVLGETERLLWGCPTLAIRVSFNNRGEVISVHRSFSGNRVTPSNVAKVRPGMSYEQVEAILGHPQESSLNGTGSYGRWQNGALKVEIELDANQRVVAVRPI